MQTYSLNNNILQCLSDLIALYLGASPECSEIKEYIELKCEEKDIIVGLTKGFVTQDEFSNFLLAHTYTKYVSHENNIRDVSEDKIDEIRKKIMGFIG